MYDFSILTALWLLLRTLPFLILRSLVSLAFLGLMIGALYGLVSLIGGPNPAAMKGYSGLVMLIAVLIGFAALFFALRWARRWVLYLIRAAHIAVLTELVQGRKLPAGEWQPGYGHRMVRARFGEASALFVLDELIRLVLRGLSRLSQGLLAILPERTAAQVSGLFRTLLWFCFGYMDEIILAHAISQRSDDPWGSARNALVLYGQNWRIILKNAFWLTLMVTVLLVPVWLWLIGPLGAEYLADKRPETALPLIAAIIVTLLFLSAVFEPFALICLMQVWFRQISTEPLSQEWSATVTRLAPQLSRHRQAGDHEQRLNAAEARGRDPGGTMRNGDLV
ncbi:hypothetical protein [Pseudogemmobacter bohemicus]|uniref:hypothetical protein n=1 Tax=Pseudogemmobacter bohemicus TaxID=2250708 RepID=UPI000DD39AA5|nr:hypothetical protein [Pseudogemmobacter bohemicus]